MSDNPIFSLSNLTGPNRFDFDGVDAQDSSGTSVSSAGDVNGDGFDDILIGAHSADPNGINGAGASYVVFGTNADFWSSQSLSNLDGTNGFRITGKAVNDRSGQSISSAGDINGDGFDDIIIGARAADRDGQMDAGESYVVFGAASGFSASLSLSDLDGSNGFRLFGTTTNGLSGYSVSSAGDVNGDGVGDLVIGAPLASPNGVLNAGESYVVFGTTSGFSASLSLADLDGSNGFRLNGTDTLGFSGRSVASAGDINGDGFDDIIVGAPGADPLGVDSAGASYVIFGAATGFSPSLSLNDLDGSNGFRLNGVAAVFGRSGYSVASAGDVNGDGLDDIIIGAPQVSTAGETPIGESYVVFGSNSGFSASMSLSDLDGTNGFRIEGFRYGDGNGTSVSSAGDVNGDGFDDILIGAPGADPNRNSEAGESYLVLGTDTGFSSTLSLTDLDGSNGFIFQGIDASDNSGASVASAGDVNGDGFDDFLIGTSRGNPAGPVSEGESYLVFGSANGFFAASPVRGTAADDWLTIPADWQLGLRQIDGGDGTDMMSFAGLDAGIYANTQTGQANSGLSSAPFDLIMASIENVTGTSHADTFNGSDRAELFRGLGGNDTFYASHAGADTYEGGGGRDTLTYAQSSEGVSASLISGRGWNGDAEGDQYSGIEDLVGSNHDDFLWGDHGDNKLVGGHGNDTIMGNDGNDYILAGHGYDTIVYTSPRSEYIIIQNGIRTDVIHTEGFNGHDIIGHAEVLQFTDGDFIL